MDETYRYYDCRVLGHSWQSVHVERAPSFGIAMDLLCSRCAMHRRDILSPYNGRLLARQYRQPEGYKSGESMSRDDWRREFLESSLGLDKRPRKHKEKDDKDIYRDIVRKMREQRKARGDVNVA